MKRAGELLSPFELVESFREAERRSKGVSPRHHRKVETRLTGRRRQSHPPADRTGSTRRRFSSHTHAVEFSRTDAGEAGNEKASARARGLRIDGLRKVVSESSEDAPGSQGFPCLPLGRPTECSSHLSSVKKRCLQAVRSDACPPGGACRRPPCAGCRAPRRRFRRASRRPGRSSAAPRSWRGRRPTR